MKMVEEKKEDEGPSLGTLIAVGVIVMTVVIGFTIYQMIAGPYATADTLRDEINGQVNVSSDYRQGWLDCVDYWLDMTVGPQNATVAIVEI